LPPVGIVRLLMALLLLAASGGPAAAGGSWRVHGKPDGLQHRLPDSSDWQPASSGLELPPGTSLRADGGAAVIGQAESRIILQNGAELILPPPETEIVFQRHGRIRYQIRPGSTQNFRVESPYLAIGIKGTRFDVLVSPAGAEVRVLEGRVAASTPDGRFSVDLLPGQTARIGALPGSVLEVRQLSGQAFGPSSGEGLAPASQHQTDAPAGRLDPADMLDPSMAAGYQREPSAAVTEPVARVGTRATGVLDRLRAGVRDLLSNVEVVPDDRVRSAPRTVVKGVRGLSRGIAHGGASRDSGGGSSGADSPNAGGSGAGSSGGASAGAGGSDSSSSGGSGDGSPSGGASGDGSGGSSSGSSSGGDGSSSSGESGSGGGLGGGLGGVGGAVGSLGDAVGGLGGRLGL